MVAQYAIAGTASGLVDHAAEALMEVATRAAAKLEPNDIAALAAYFSAQ